jgi:hypothetical protein
LGSKVLAKFNVTIEKNTGFAELKAISNVLKSNENDTSINLDPTQMCNLMYAPIVTCDVERSFSRFKSIFRDNRRSFLAENLEMYVIVNCNVQEKEFD